MVNGDVVPRHFIKPFSKQMTHDLDLIALAFGVIIGVVCDWQKRINRKPSLLPCTDMAAELPASSASATI